MDEIGTVLLRGRGAGKDGVEGEDTGEVGLLSKGHLRDSLSGEVEGELGDLEVVAPGGTGGGASELAGSRVDSKVVAEETVVLANLDESSGVLDEDGVVGEFVGRLVDFDGVRTTGNHVPATPGAVFNLQTGGRDAPVVERGGLDGHLGDTTLSLPVLVDNKSRLVAFLARNGAGRTAVSDAHEGGDGLSARLASESHTAVRAEDIKNVVLAGLGLLVSRVEEMGGQIEEKKEEAKEK